MNFMRALFYAILFSLPVWAVALGGAFLILFTPSPGSAQIPSPHPEMSHIFNGDLTVKSPAPVVRNATLGDVLGVPR